MNAAPPNIIELPGCTPEPLMNYLKALGLLRIIAEQGFDPQVRGFWKNDVFCLRTVLSEAELTSALLTRFSPTAILSPWNGEAGFLSETGSGVDAIKAISNSKALQLQVMQQTIEEVQKIDSLASLTTARAEEKILKKKKKTGGLSEPQKEALKLATKTKETIKDRIIYEVRSTFPESVLPWLDACMVITNDGFKPAPFLGSGGVDGRFEFSVNYIENARLVLESDQSPGWLSLALFEQNSGRLVPSSIGQFAPGRIGGANGTQGTEGSSMVNPWDFVFMLEGSLFLAGSVTRKLGCVGGSKAAFPFTVNATAVGAGTIGDQDDKKSKGELWLPLWHRASSVGELRKLFAEGRGDLNGRHARDGLEFSRAVAGLGVDRGIKAFTRFGFLERNGMSMLAAPLGNFPVPKQPFASLLAEIELWLLQLRLACGDKSPARFQAALREVERAIFDYCQFGDTAVEKFRFQRVLVACGQAERLIAASPGFREKAKGLRPLGPLPASWVHAAADSTAEFRIALALASLRDQGLGGLRIHLENVQEQGRRVSWAETNPAAVWSAADLATNLSAILSRRVMEAERSNGPCHPLRSRHRVALKDVSAFLNAELDEERISQLLWGLSLCDSWSYQAPPKSAESDALTSLPASYALLKLLFHAPASGHSNESRPHPGILALLRAHRLPEACQRAAQTLRASSRPTIPQAMRGFPSRDAAWQEASWQGVSPTRLAAALLIPIFDSTYLALEARTLRPTENLSIS